MLFGVCGRTTAAYTWILLRSVGVGHVWHRFGCRCCALIGSGRYSWHWGKRRHLLRLACFILSETRQVPHDTTALRLPSVATVASLPAEECGIPSQEPNDACLPMSP